MQLPEIDKAAFYDRLQHYAAAIDDDPQTNSVFRLAQDVFAGLSSGAVSIDDLETVVSDIETDLFDERTQFLAEQHGLPKEDTFEDLQFQLADAAQSGFEAFRNLIETPRGGIVFTAHPTFATPKMVRAALASQTVGNSVPSDKKIAPADEDFQITLVEEHAEAQSAIEHAQASLERYVDGIFETAKAHFPNKWMELHPAPPTIASWVAYDLDGRSDITWWTSIAFRLQEKSRQLARYASRLQSISGNSAFIERRNELADLLTASADHTADLSRLFFRDLSQPDLLVEAANKLTRHCDQKLVSLAPVCEALTDLLGEASPAAAKSLLVLRTQMETIGLGTARIHLRINAAQIQSVIRRDLGLATESHELGQVAIDTLAQRIEQNERFQINFSDLFLEQATAKRQLMLCAQILKHIDADQPIRFLIAESENPATVLGAVYLAHLYGVSDKLDISPLFETPEALENGGRFVTRLLQVPAFRAYVKSRNQLSIQLGFSDAGRFIGQVAADIAIERIQNQIARSLADYLPGTPLLFFNTHGESIGRGAFPGTFEQRLQHVLPDKTKSTCEKRGLPLRHEVSFQGGDGFLHFAEPVLSDTVYFAFARFGLCKKRSDQNDPFYSQSSLVWDFYRALRQWHEALFDDASYASLLSDFAGGFLVDAGSRPRRRSGGPAGPRSLRAIAHNATLQQLGVPVNTACGIGSSLRRDMDALVELVNTSPRLRALIDLAVFARVRTSIPALRGYASVYSPTFWVASSKRTDERRIHARETIARLLEDGRTNFAIMTCANRFSIDLGRFDRLIARLQNAPSVEKRHESRLAIHTIHAIRQGLMLRALEIAGDLPIISARHGFDIGDVQRLILSMRIGEAVEFLRTLFPVGGGDLGAFQAMEEPRSGSGQMTAHDYRQLNNDLIAPLDDIERIIQRLSQAVSHAHFAFG